MLRTVIARCRAPPSSVAAKALASPPFAAPFSSRRRKDTAAGDGDGDDGDRSFFFFEAEGPPKLFVVQPRLRPPSLLQSKLSEAINLANSLEEPREGFYDEDFASKEKPPCLVVQNPASRSLRADTYFGPGTVKDIKCHINALESEGGQVNAVFVNAILSGIQQRNLEMAWNKPVLDRVGLIIEIFNAHAETKEAKLQAELAALMYKKSRLVRVRGPGGRLTFGEGGEAQVVSARGRGSGGRGFISGAGETELQLQRRRIHERRNYLLSQIEEVRRTRAIQRHGRRRSGGSRGKGLATVAVVGYTNAGKSTLVSVISKSDVYSDDRLFATVDPRLRSVVLPSGRKILLSDTVGFISDLPVQLVEAFHATLEEVVEADLLVHVLNSSAPNLEEQRSTVLEVLRQIGVSEDKIKNMVEVWNKIDLLDENTGIDEALGEDEWLREGEEENETMSGDECENGGKEEYSETFQKEECMSGGEETLSEVEDGFTSNQEEHSSASNLSSDESMGSVDNLQSMSFEHKRLAHLEASDAKDGIVKTSAVTGVGLQELLCVIDKKLNEQKTILTRSLGPFDRKWRPSSTTEAEEVAQQ